MPPPRPDLGPAESRVLIDVVLACQQLVDLTLPDGPLADMKTRGRVSGRAKWLLNELARLARELAGEPEPEPDDPDPAAIAARAEAIKKARLG